MSSESVELLFSKHTVEEIRDVEKKTRQEIETKKEDLRQMVGERYRDLIEAADTIAEMKKCAGNLKNSVQSLQKYTNSKFDHKGLSNKAKQSQYSVERYMEISAQVKLIMEVSETIWSRVENGNMIEATHLYLQSRQVLKNLNLDGSTTYCPILNWFPVLGQQAQALDNLRSTILNECRTLMTDERLDSKSIAEAICSIILLENTNLKSAFEEFMKIRLSTIESKFESSQELGAVKLSKVVTLLSSTLKQVHTLFVQPFKAEDDCEKSVNKKSKMFQDSESDKIGLVHHVLEKSLKSFHNSTNVVETLEFTEEKLWTKHLPDSVSKLSFLQESNGDVLPSTALQTTCKKWLSDCEQVVKTGTLDILLYVTNFKGLNALRETLWETFEDDVMDNKKSGRKALDDGDLEAVENKVTEWEQACLSTLGQYFSIWDSILSDLFLVKVKSLCQKLFSDLVVNGKEKISEILSSLKADGDSNGSTCEFIWSESPGDILSDTAWRQVSIKISKDVKGGLGLKALTVTPVLHNACQQLNNAMKQAILDLSNYVPDILKSNKNPRKSTSEQTSSSVSIKERSLVCSYFQDACAECLKDFLKIFEGYRSQYSADSAKENTHISEILFLSMFCRNFCHLCEEFRNGCTLGQNQEELPLKRQMSSSITSSHINQTTISPVWEDICNNLLEESNKFSKLWSRTIIEKAVSNFKTSLLDLRSALHFFDTLPCWDHVKIQEESETGSKVESEIKLPSSLSWPAQDLLYSVCDNVSQVGGHSFSQSMLQDLADSLLNGVLDGFIQLKNAISKTTVANGSDIGTPGSQSFSVSQPWAMQRLFDLRVLHGILYSVGRTKTHKDSLYEVPEDAFSKLIDWLEGFIDPFDLDVFAPHLTKNIQRNISSSKSLLGFIISEKADVHQSINQSSKSGGGNSHNILPIAADCGRFPYLPISSRMSKTDKMALPASIKNHLPLSSALKQLTEVDKKMEGGRKQSLYSKLGALSSSWLSSVTSEN